MVANIETLPYGCLSFKFGSTRHAKTNDPSVGTNTHTHSYTQADNGGGSVGGAMQVRVIQRFSLWPIDSGFVVHFGHNTRLCSKHVALPLTHWHSRTRMCTCRLNNANACRWVELLLRTHSGIIHSAKRSRAVQRCGCARACALHLSRFAPRVSIFLAPTHIPAASL